MKNFIVDCLLLVYSAVVRFVMIIASFCRFTSSRQSVHINALSEECLLLIFDRIPLAELMRLDQVCARWAMLLPSATARRHTLALIIGGYRLHAMRFEIPFNDDFEITSYAYRDGYYRPYFNLLEHESALTLPSLVPKSFDEFLLSNLNLKGFFDILYDHTSIGVQIEADLTEMARFKHALATGQVATYFAYLFPNVKTLLVIHPECFETELQSVVDLLNSWSLVNVKLWIHTVGIDKKYENLPEKHPIGTLLRSIINQKALQQLTLNIAAVGKGQTTKFSFPVESYSFISQLRVAKLSLGFYDTDNTIWKTVHLFDSPKLENIGLGNCADLLLNSAFNEEFAYTHKVHQLYSLRSFGTVEEFGPMCSRFSSLTMLELYWHSNLTFTELVANLSSLRQLSYLILNIRFRHQPQNPFALVEQVANDQEELRTNSLPHVKILKFLIEKRTHRDFESFSPQVFPSVETIIIENLPSTPPVTECSICRPVNLNRPRNLLMAKRCDRLLILSLRGKFARNSPIRIYPLPVTDIVLLIIYLVVVVLAMVLLITAVVILSSVLCLLIWLIGLAVSYFF